MANVAKNILVSGYIGFNNFGDEAIFYALSTHLKSLGFNVSVLCNNKNIVKKTYQVKTYHYKKPQQILKALLSNDILISGGGSLLQNKTSNFSLFYYLFIILLAKLLFKKVIIFSQGFEPIKGFLPCLITKTVLKTVDYITVRDKKSEDYLKSLKINSDLTSDPVYSLVQDMSVNENKKGLIVQLRSFQGINEKFVQDLAKSVSKYNKEPVSVFSFQDEFDKKICIDFIEELKKNGVQAEFISNKTIDETLEIINNSKFVISTRLHGLIAATALKSKVFALKYDDKIQTLTDELNISNIDIFNYTNNELDNKLDEFFNHCLNEVHPYRHFYWDCIDSNLKK